MIHGADHKPLYEIWIDSSFACLPEKVRACGLTGKKCLIVTDTNVGPLYGKEAAEKLAACGCESRIFAIPAGEVHKTLRTVETVYRALIEQKYDRSSFIAALGGGVVGDLAGFSAATYLRGIPFIQIPTTLLAQSDSSVGGKTGVDFDGYKNMVGAFAMPKLVYMNTSVLSTMEERAYLSGMGEVIKSALLGDAELYGWLKDHADAVNAGEESALELMIRRTAAIKVGIVRRDPEEHGERALLNFGHTIGHAVEKYLKFAMQHGCCVALGLVAASKISTDRGLITEEELHDIEKTCGLYGLPLRAEGIDAQEVLRFTKSDKKMQAGKIKFILLKEIGKAVIDTSLSDDDLLEGINEILR